MGLPRAFGTGVASGAAAASGAGESTDDGKRSPAMDVVVACLSSEKGGGLEEGGLGAPPDRRDADYSRRLEIAVLPAWQLTLAPFSRKLGFSNMRKTEFYLHGSSFFNNSYFFVNFLVFQGFLETAVLPAWQLAFGEVSPHIFEFY